MSTATKTAPAIEEHLNDAAVAEAPEPAEERVTAFTIGAQRLISSKKN
jgi:hypothetical protein